MTLNTWLMLITLATLWGASFFFIEVAVSALPPLTIVFIRTLLGAATLYVVIYLRGLTIPKDKAIWLAFFIMGALNNLIPFSLIIWGQVYISSSLASILNATVPFFTVIIAHLLTQDEKITVAKLIGISFGLLGVVVTIGYQSLSGFDDNLLPQLAVLMATVSYALAAIFGRRFKEMKVKPLMIATGQLTGSTLLLLPIMLWVDQPWTLSIPHWHVVTALIALAVPSTALAYILFFRILANAGATNVTLVTLLVPISAVLLGVFLLSEALAVKHIWGMVFIALGLLVIDGRLLRVFKTKQTN